MNLPQNGVEMISKKKPNQGRVFEQNFERSVKESVNWFFRVRDVNPMALRNNFMIPRNPYDLLIFNGNYLFTLELKSTQSKSISHRGSNPQIKEHQIEALKKASEFDNVISGIVVNFREEENKTFFIHIDDYLTYDAVSKGELIPPYENKHNEKSIPLKIVEEIGIEILNVKKRVHYQYFINDFINQAVSDYNRRKSS